MKITFRKLKTADDNIQISFDNKNTFENYDKNTALSDGISVPDECADFSNIVVKTNKTELSNLAYEISTDLFSQGNLSSKLDSRIKDLKIPEDIISIDAQAFKYCSGLTSINYRGTEVQWNNITKEPGWNNNCPAVVNYNYVG